MGSLELILGPMFSGKTSALQSIIRRHEALGFKCVAYKPQIDTRYQPGDDLNQDTDTYFIYNHDRAKAAAQSVTALVPVRESALYKAADLIVVEEGQFFNDLYKFVLNAVETDTKHVIVAGLDGDRFRKPFGQLLELIPIADRITKLTSLCKLCATDTSMPKAVPALFSYSGIETTAIIHVAGPECYIPLCRKHYLESTKPDS